MRAKPPVLDKPFKKERALSQEEKILWQRVVAGEAVALPRKAHAKEAASESSLYRSADTVSHARSKVRTEEVKTTLDLHGHTLNTAYNALHKFMMRAKEQGIAKVIVITGKGRAEGFGSLRGMLPYWLQETELKYYVTGFRHADARQGGDGAWVVRLRKEKQGRNR
ncbi:MAG TPA: Smr/MutS family protein [Rickettsiales bacterium]|nr:Smr/MutS family protein [Rickettsiales bacterium]